MASISKNDLRAFYRAGATIGYGWEHSGPEPTVEEIDEWFEAAYTRWREGKKPKAEAFIEPTPDCVPLPFAGAEKR